MPNIGPLTDADKLKELSIRLSNFANHLDFIVNFYSLSVKNLSQDKIKILIATVKFIDWQRTTPDSASECTAVLSGIIATEKRKTGDPIMVMTFNDSLSRLASLSKSILVLLKEFSDYNREEYKGEVRETITNSLTSPLEATLDNIKKKFPKAMPGKPFYTELVAELIAEDCSPDGPALQKAVLARLAISEKTEEPKKKAEENVRTFLNEGLNALGSAGATLTEVLDKVDVNHMLLQNQKQSFGARLKKLLNQLFNTEPDPIFYHIATIDPNKGQVIEKLEYGKFRGDMEKKCRILGALAANGAAMSKINAMEEKHVLELLEKNIADLNQYHRHLIGLDDYFKSSVPPQDRSKVRGIKPELSTISNAAARAGEKRSSYLAIMEEKVQFSKLGIE
jgi:hypothetical protein